MSILLLNAGSSSLKATLMASLEGGVVAHGAADWAGAATQYRYVGPDGAARSSIVAWRGHAAAVRQFVHDLTNVAPVALADPASLRGVGHRVVHGGEFRSAVRLTAAVRARLAALADLAPLHNPPSLAALAAAEEILPNVPQAAVFDTAFHATLPPEASTFAVPELWTRAWGVRRYGFHGLSHAYCSRRAAELLGRPVEELRTIVCHLGHGCSASAILGGRCVDTTMGFTPLDGLMMATRCGSLDPAVVLHVQQRHGLTVEQVDAALNRESGLLGVSGRSGDMREILAAAAAGDERSRLALAMYVRRVRQAIGAFAATLGGVDALVFTAGVGEHASEVRSAVCKGLECLDLLLDPRLNSACEPDCDVARRSSCGRILVVRAREDVAMLWEVRAALESSDGP